MKYYEFIFDVRGGASVTIEADSEEEAREKLYDLNDDDYGYDIRYREEVCMDVEEKD